MTVTLRRLASLVGPSGHNAPIWPSPSAPTDAPALGAYLLLVAGVALIAVDGAIVTVIRPSITFASWTLPGVTAAVCTSLLSAEVSQIVLLRRPDLRIALAYLVLRRRRGGNQRRVHDRKLTAARVRSGPVDYSLAADSLARSFRSGALRGHRPASNGSLQAVHSARAFSASLADQYRAICVRRQCKCG